MLMKYNDFKEYVMESKLYIVRVRDEMLSGKHEMPADYDYDDYLPFSKANINAIAENLKDYYANQIVVDNVLINLSNSTNGADDFAKKLELRKALPTKFKDIFKSLEASDFISIISCYHDNKSITLDPIPGEARLNRIPKTKAFFDQYPDLEMKYH